MVIAAVVLVIFTLAQTALPPLSRKSSLGSNLSVILLFDLSFLLVGLLLFLVGRNLAKAIFERREGLIGSKLQVRLVMGFVAAALFPTLFLLYVSESFLRANLDSWFNPQYAQVLDNSLEIAKTYYLNSANDSLHFARVLAQQISGHRLMDPAQRAELQRMVAEKQQEYDLGTIEVFGRDRNLIVLALSPKTPTGVGVAPESPLLAATLAGRSLTRTDRLGEADIIRGTSPIYAAVDSDTVAGAVVVDYFLPKSVSQSAGAISHTFRDYLQLRILKQPILRSYLMVLLLIGLVVVLLASWLGIYLARGITVPIKLLAAGTHAVAAGNLQYQIEPVGDDEIGHLVTSFNQMTADLRDSGAELERRRRYTETILRNVSAGVVALDPEGHVTTINPHAERLLSVTAERAMGRHYTVAFPELGTLDDVLASGLDHESGHDLQRSIKLEDAAGGVELLMTASALADESGDRLGSVLFFEDVSQLAKVERMEVWREVARRIAHEIKNPLTPIQLSAERLRRHFAGGADNGLQLVDECTRTIIGEVEDLKRLVNEFSAFARMPHISPIAGDLNALAEETVVKFRDANPEVEFAISLDPALPPVTFDREALKRALVNLLDNGVSASIAVNGKGMRPRLEIVTRFDPRSGVVALEIADNGAGIEPRLRTRIFEPYFSTKTGGTGLGLAIVSSIITDHHGFIRVRDNQPRGSRFIIEFPSTSPHPVRYTA